MPITVVTQDNPLRSVVGQETSQTTIINSDLPPGTVRYQIERRDGQDSFIISSATDITNYPNVVSVSYAQLQIILPGRQRYRVRVDWTDGDPTGQNVRLWSGWTAFKTRDKTYKSPNPITAITDDSTESDPTNKGSVTVVVVNNAKTIETRTARGSTVVNSDTGYVSTSSVAYTSRGATIVNAD